MPLVGERSGNRWAFTTSDDLFTASWDLDFPPRAAFIKVFQGGYFEFDDQSAVDIGLMDFRRLPSGADETIVFPDIDAFQHRLIEFDGTMTHVTFGMSVRGGVGDLVYTLGFWN